MLKIIFSLFVSLSIVSTSFAQTTPADKLSAVVNQLHYNLTVEWDQKNQSLFDQYMDSFRKDMETLKEGGLTEQDVNEFLRSNFIAKENVARFDELTKLSSFQGSNRNDFLVKNLPGLFAQGSSWEMDLGVDGPLIFWTTTAFVAALIIFGTTGEE